jgi:hypothetical protein
MDRSRGDRRASQRDAADQQHQQQEAENGVSRVDISERDMRDSKSL